MRRRSKIILAIVVVVVAAAGGLAYYVLKDDAPPPVALSTECTADGVDDIAGEWTVIAADPTVAGYRVDEVLSGINKTAAGRTSKVTGSATIDGSTVTEAEFVVDMTSLTSDESRRDNRIRTDGLQTDTFKTATFTLTEPIELGSGINPCETVDVTANGTLELHGVTKDVAIGLQAKIGGGEGGARLEVAGSLPIAMADYDINPPNIGGFVTVEDNGLLEVQLFFEQR